MSYTNLIEKEGIKAAYLIVLKPGRVVSDWNNITGNIYSSSFDFGYVVGVSVNGVALAEGSSASLGASEFFFNRTSEVLYINTASPSTKTITVTYELYYSTLGQHWYRDPLDDTTFQVYYEPIIVKEPQFKATLSDSLLGFIPSQSSTLELNNAEHTLEYHLYDSSFNNKDCSVYHWLDTLTIENVSKVADAKTKNITYTPDRVSIEVLDRVDVFSDEFRDGITNFYGTTTFPNLDPNFKGRPIRFVYGMAEGCQLVNIDYEDDAPTTNDNRVYVARQDAVDDPTYTGTVPNNSSTTSLTYLDSVVGLNIGDRVYFNKGTPEYRIVRSVDRVNNTITHATLTAACVTNDTVERGSLGNLQLEQDGAIYKLYYNRDYTESNADGVLKVTLSSSIESTFSINTLTGSETLTARIYGPKNYVELGGSAFGSDSSIYGNLTNPAVILLDIIKKAGISEDEIDASSFQALSTSIGDVDNGLSIPKDTISNFTAYKDIIASLLSSNLLRLYLNDSNKWTVSEIAKHGTEDFEVAEDEILDSSINYKINYKDVISDVIVLYRIQDSDASEKETSRSDTARYLHGISKQKSFRTSLLNASDASSLADKLGYIYGDRSGDLTLRLKNRFYTSSISDIIKVELKKLLGYNFDNETLFSRKFNVTEVFKGLRQITLKLNDQKGVEDNF